MLFPYYVSGTYLSTSYVFIFNPHKHSVKSEPLYKWAKYGPWVIYFFTAAWNLLAQKPTGNKLKCLHIQLF